MNGNKPPQTPHNVLFISLSVNIRRYINCRLIMIYFRFASLNSANVQSIRSSECMQSDILSQRVWYSTDVPVKWLYIARPLVYDYRPSDQDVAIHLYTFWCYCYLHVAFDVVSPPLTDPGWGRHLMTAMAYDLPYFIITYNHAALKVASDLTMTLYTIHYTTTSSTVRGGLWGGEGVREFRCLSREGPLPRLHRIIKMIIKRWMCASVSGNKSAWVFNIVVVICSDSLEICSDHQEMSALQKTNTEWKSIYRHFVTNILLNS